MRQTNGPFTLVRRSPFLHRTHLYLVHFHSTSSPVSLRARLPIHHPSMADLYPPSYSPRTHQSYNRHPDQQQYSTQLNPSGLVYPPQLMASQHSGSSNGSSEEIHDQPPSPSKSPDQQPPKSETKPQATFLTKLYACVVVPWWWISRHVV